MAENLEALWADSKPVGRSKAGGDELEALWEKSKPVEERERSPDLVDKAIGIAKLPGEMMSATLHGDTAAIGRKAAAGAMGLTDLATFGHADELGGGMEAVKATITGAHPELPFAEKYRRGRDSYRELDRRVEAGEPGAYGAGELGALAMAPPTEAPAAGAGIGARVAPWVAQGAVFGGLGASGHSTADLTRGQGAEYAGDVAKGVGVGGLAGGATGFAVEGGSMLLNKGASVAGDRLQALRQTLARREAGAGAAAQEVAPRVVEGQVVARGAVPGRAKAIAAKLSDLRGVMSDRTVAQPMEGIEDTVVRGAQPARDFERTLNQRAPAPIAPPTRTMPVAARDFEGTAALPPEPTLSNPVGLNQDMTEVSASGARIGPPRIPTSAFRAADAQIAAAPGQAARQAAAAMPAGAIKGGGIGLAFGHPVKGAVFGAARGAYQRLVKSASTNPEVKAALLKKAQSMLQTDPSKAQRLFQLIDQAAVNAE